MWKTFGMVMCVCKSMKHFRLPGNPENCFQLCRPSDTDNIQLIRFLGAASREDPTRDSAVMQKLLVWDHVGSVPTDVRTPDICPGD